MTSVCIEDHCAILDYLIFFSVHPGREDKEKWMWGRGPSIKWQWRDAPDTIVECWQASVVRSEEVGSFNNVAGMSIVTAGSLGSVKTL